MLDTMPVIEPAVTRTGRGIRHLNAEQRIAIARKAAQVRWSQPRKPRVKKFAVCPRCGLEAPTVAPKSEATA
jgi:hypothetical protein